MTVQTLTLQVPETLLRRLEMAAQALHRPVTEVALHALEVGSPPTWEDVPPEFQADLAALERLEDAALWPIAQGRYAEPTLDRYEALLAQQKISQLPDLERQELDNLRHAADRFMLRKAHAAALLRWRGYVVPSMA